MDISSKGNPYSGTAPPFSNMQPWDFDANIHRALLEAQSQGKKDFYLLPGGRKDWERVITLYTKCSLPGLSVAKVEVIYNQAMLEGFEARLVELEKREGNPAFQAKWLSSVGDEKRMRLRVYDELLKKCDRSIQGFPHVNIVPAFHAIRNKAIIPHVLSSHLANLGTTDEGYFGNGLYFTSCAEYAERVYGGDRTLLYNWISFFSAYPVNYEDDEGMWKCLAKTYWLNANKERDYKQAKIVAKLYGKGNLGNHDAHYVLVAPKDPKNPKEVQYFPIKSGQDPTYDEIVVFQSNQVLPRYVVTLGTTEVNVKSLTVVHTIDELKQALERFKENPSRSFYLKRSIDRMLEEVSQKEGNLELSDEFNWVLAHVVCLTCCKDEKFKEGVEQKLLHYFQLKNPQGKIESKIIVSLQNFYRKQKEIPRLMGPSQSIEQNYIQLVLVQSEEREKPPQRVSEKENKKAEKGADEKEAKENYEDKRFNSWEDIHRAKKPIELGQLFDKQAKEEKDPHKLLLLGRAGIGKSVLCQYLAYQWANQKLWNTRFDAVIWIPLRKIQHLKEDINVAFLIIQHCISPSEQKEIHSSEMDTFIQQGKERILFILDGYDEISSSLQPGSPQDKVIRELLDYPQWIVTSRPYAVHGLKAERTLENVGFTDLHVRDYICQTLSLEQSTSLLQTLHTNPWLSKIANIPLNLELLCCLWESQKNVEPALKTLTNLYQRFVFELQKRFLSRLEPQVVHWLEEDVNKHPRLSSVMSFLEEMAWKGLEKKDLRVSLQDPEFKEIFLRYRPLEESQNPFIQDIQACGFLSSSVEEKNFFMQEHYFMHLTFQEFFAASYIQRLFSQNPALVQKLIQTHKLNPQYQIVWWFASGLLKTHPENLNRFFEIMEHPKDLIGFYEFQLKARCLDECEWSDQLKKKSQYLEEAKFWCQWLINPILRLMIGKSLTETLKMSPCLSQSIATPLLLEALKDEDRWIRRNAAEDLGEVSQTSAQAVKEVIPALLDALKDREQWTHGYVFEALGKVGQINEQTARKVIPRLLENLDNHTIFIFAGTEQILEALGKVGKVNEQTARAVVPRLLAVLEDPKTYYRTGVVRALGEVGQANAQIAKEVIPHLLLKNSFWTFRKEEIVVLVEFFKANAKIAKEVIPHLLLKSSFRPSQIGIVALGEFFKADAQIVKEIIPHLLEVFKNSNGDVMQSSIKVLGEIGKVNEQTAKEIIPRLLEALNKDWRFDKFVKKADIEALEELGKLNTQTAKEFIPQLIKGLKNQKFDVREAAICSLIELSKINKQNAKEVTSRLLDAFKDPTLYVRLAVVMTLTEVGKVDKEIAGVGVSLWLEAFKNSKWDVIQSSVKVLGEIAKVNKQTAKEVIPQLLKASKDLVGDNRRLVVQAMAEIGKFNEQAAMEVIPRLIEALSDSEECVQKAACEALGELIKLDEKIVIKKEVIPRLLKASKDLTGNNRRSVFQAMAKVGKFNEQVAMEVITRLIEALSDSEEYVQKAAFETLGELIKLDEKIVMKIVHGLLEKLKNLQEELEALKNQEEEALKNQQGELDSLKEIGSEFFQVNFFPLVHALRLMCKPNTSTVMKVIPGFILGLKELEKLATKSRSISSLFAIRYFFLDSFMYECFQCTDLSLSSFLRSYGEQGIEEATYLKIIMTKCCTENIPLFLDHQCLCFYYEGFQSIALPRAMERALILGNLTKKHSQDWPLACNIRSENQEMNRFSWYTRLAKKFKSFNIPEWIEDFNLNLTISSNMGLYLEEESNAILEHTPQVFQIEPLPSISPPGSHNE